MPLEVYRNRGPYHLLTSAEEGVSGSVAENSYRIGSFKYISVRLKGTQGTVGAPMC